MKITKARLKQIIKEELANSLSENKLADILKGKTTGKKPAAGSLEDILSQTGASPKKAAQAAQAAITSLPDLIKLVCKPGIKLKTGKFGQLFNIGNIEAPGPRDILKDQIRKVINSKDPYKAMDQAINNMFRLYRASGHAPKGLNLAKIKNMVMNYRPAAELPMPIPGLSKNPTVKELLTKGFKLLSQPEKAIGGNLGGLAGAAMDVFGSATGAKIKPIDIARQFARENVDSFVDQACKYAAQASKQVDAKKLSALVKGTKFQEVTKSELAQIVKEEVGELENKYKKKSIRNSRDLAKMIAGPAKVFGAYETPDELKNYTLSVYSDLMNQVIVEWGKQASSVYGCEMNPETKECQIISSVMKDFHSKIGPLVDAGSGLEGKAAARFILKNSRMLAASMDWVPASKNYSDFPRTKAWQKAEKSNVYADPDDDL